MKRGWQIGVGLVIGFAMASRAFAESGTAVIRGTTEGSSVSGSATLVDTPAGVEVTIQVSGVSPGQHGLHIHQFGGCGNGGSDAGGHYNPDSVPHGFLPTDGFVKAHAGDLGNIEVAQDGTGSLHLILPGLVLSGGAYSIGARAIILHEKVDDFGQPTGNAGGRIGCGPVLITGQ